MRTEKFHVSLKDGKSLVSQKNLNKLLLQLLIDNKEHNMFYDADKHTFTVIWND